MKFAYADPPYVGMANNYKEKTEVDQEALIKRLCDEFPDGWVLSCHSPSLRVLLPICPDDIRIAAWVKTWASFKPGVNPAYAWEPVLFRGGRKKPRDSEPTVRDWMACRIATDTGLFGAKPIEFARWVFSLLNAKPSEDEL